MIFRSLEHITVSENTIESEAVLIFQVTSAAPFKNFYSYFVGSFTYIVCDIKFCLKMASLGKTNILIVDGQICAGCNAFKYKVQTSPLLFNFKFAFINSTWVIIWNIWRITRIWIVDICVVWIFIAMKLPAGWHRNLVPFFNLFRNINISVKICKVPFAIQKMIFAVSAWNIIASGWSSVFTCEIQLFIRSHSFALLSLY